MHMEENLLRDILRLRPVAQEPQAHCIHRVLVAGDELGEMSRLSSTHARDELVIFRLLVFRAPWHLFTLSARRVRCQTDPTRAGEKTLQLRRKKRCPIREGEREAIPSDGAKGDERHD